MGIFKWIGRQLGLVKKPVSKPIIHKVKYIKPTIIRPKPKMTEMMPGKRFFKKPAKGIKESVVRATEDARIKKLGYDPAWFITDEIIKIGGKWTYPSKKPKDDLFGMFRRFTDSDPDKVQTEFSVKDGRGYYVVRSHFSLQEVINGEVSFETILGQLQSKLKVPESPFMGFCIWYKTGYRVPLTKFWVG